MLAFCNNIAVASGEARESGGNWSDCVILLALLAMMVVGGLIAGQL